jgi:serine/threonine-protein kinase
MSGEHTAAIQSPADLGSTMALPSLAEMAPGPQGVHGGYGAPGMPIPPAQLAPYGPLPTAQSFGGFPHQGLAPSFGAPQANPALTPAGMVGGVPMNLPIAAPLQAGQPQSQIETALSLPRPDPTALWLAQQDKQRGERRHLGVLIAVISLVVLCVVGIGALVVFKVRARAHAAAKADSGAPATATPSGAATTGEETAAATAPTATSTPSATAAPATAPPAASATATATPPPTTSVTAAAAATTARTPPPAPTPQGTSAQAAAAPKPMKEEPGFLTIVCNPSCDDVVDQGRSLGPAPVVHLAVAPGQHRITVKKGKDSKTISVIVVSGQVTAQRVSMK